MGVQAPRRAQRASAERRAKLVLCAIGGPLLAAGIGVVATLVWPDVALWLRARQFVAVPATLLEVDLDIHYGRKKGTTERVRTRYRYVVGERAYEGTRVAISEAPDNIGDFQRKQHERLRRAQQSGESVEAWVDPAAPGDALLHRDMRWGLLALKVLFASAFAGVGALFVRAAFGSAREPVLELDAGPAQVGGVLSGALALPERCAADDRFWFRLACARNGTTVWQQDVLAKIEPCAQGVRLRFRFEVPSGLPPSRRADGHHSWTLHASAEREGVELDRTFDVTIEPAGAERRS
jgi:hypothetical protein